MAVVLSLFLLPTAASAATPSTIFGAATPATGDSGDSRSVVLGVKFRSEIPGSVIGVRFYKASANTGTHVGSLWTTSGTLLASGTFTGESASGWQQLLFASPVAITANTTFVASYLAPKGHYSDTAAGFASSGVTNPPLSALANSVSADGVYVYGASNAFPTNTYHATNYWVDVLFEPTGAPTVPGQVASVVASAGNASAALSWSAPSNGGSQILSYTVTPYIGNEAQPTTTVTGTPPVTNATVNGLKNGTNYTFKVTAANSVGPGPASEPSNAITPATTPSAPTGVVASAGNASAALSWSAPSNGGSQILSYTVTPYIGNEAQPTTTVTGTPPVTNATVNGLKNGTNYTFKVTATNSVGPGPASEPSNAITPATTPSAPTGVVASAGNASAALSWSAPSNGGSQILSYTVTPYIGTEAQPTTTVTGTPPVTNATVNGLKNGTNYTFKVTATNSVGPGPASEPSNAITPGEGATAPGAPAGVVASAGNASATLSWSAPSNGGSQILSYTVTPYIGNEAQPTTTVTGTPPVTNATVNGLKNGTNYTFKVTATNSVGPGPASEPSNAITPATTPSAPTGVVASAGNASAALSWSAPSNGGSQILSYTVTPYIGNEAQPTTTVTGTPPVTNATVNGLKNGTTYTFKVTATNSVGPGPASEPSNAITPAGAAIAYPDLQLLMPTGEIYITHGGTTRTLEFTHITWNAGAGPLDIRPRYNSTTGISQGYQDLYTSPRPGVWNLDHQVPIVGPMYWEPPTDYRFPVDKFWLYNVGASGAPGHVVASSPKVDFCLTADRFVGGVPNSATTNEYQGSGCSSPEGTLGLGVGWGDEYDATDGGEGIDVSGLENGTYWLRGEVDPYHYLAESSATNNTTDTKLQINNDTVTVLEQVHPESTPPSVAVTSPTAGASLSGTTQIAASASGSAPITSVQFLLDGQPIGAPVTAPPYTIEWPIGGTTPGTHYLSAQATDENGSVGTAPAVQVTTSEGSGGGGSDTTPPTVFITNPAPGQTVSNTRQVAAAASDNVAVKSVQFYLDGTPLGESVTREPYAVSWDTTTTSNGSHTLTATATDTSGNTGSSAPVQVTVQNPAEQGPCFVMDANVTANGHGTLTTQSFVTAEAGEQLFAFVGADGPAGANHQSATVSGAGLVWTPVVRANSQSGDAEIWTATATAPLSNATVTSSLSSPNYDQSLTVISMQMSLGFGAVASSGAAKGAPSVSLKTTEAGSLVFGVGNDYDNAVSRTLGPNQVILHQWLDTQTGDTYWSQYTGAITGPAGETVTLNDTAPTSDHWNMAAVEIRGDGPDS